LLTVRNIIARNNIGREGGTNFNKGNYLRKQQFHLNFTNIIPSLEVLYRLFLTKLGGCGINSKH